MSTHHLNASDSKTTSYLGWSVLALAMSIPLYRPWVGMAAVLILIIWIFGGGVRRRLHDLTTSRLNLAVLVFIGVNLLSLAWSAFPGDGFRYTRKYWYLLLIPVLASAVTPVFRRAAVTVFAFAAAASSAVSIAIFCGLFRFGGAHPGNPSPLMHHIDFSLILALAALLILNRLLHGDLTSTRRTVWIVLFSVVVCGLLVNIGRSGHLAFIGGLAALLGFWALGRSKRTLATAAAVLLIGLAATWYGMPRVRDRVQEGTGQIRAAVVDKQFQGSLGGRVAATLVAGEIIRAHPLLGTGVGANMPEFRRILESEYPEFSFAISWYPHFHNQYTQIATELGLLGLLSLAWIFFELVRGPIHNREFKATAIILATVYLLGFIGEPFLHKQLTLVAFALFAGLIAGEQLDSSDRGQRRGTADSVSQQ